MEVPRRIPYTPRWGTIIACAGFFGACAAFMAYKARHNTRGLVLNGIITLEPAGATVFYWVMALLAAGFVLIAFLMTVNRLSSPRYLEVGTDALLLPHGRFQRQISRIAYADIQSVSEGQVSGQRFLYIHAGGLRYTLTASLLPDNDTYNAVKDLLISRAS